MDKQLDSVLLLKRVHPVALLRPQMQPFTAGHQQMDARTLGQTSATSGAAATICSKLSSASNICLRRKPSIRRCLGDFVLWLLLPASSTARIAGATWEGRRPRPIE